MGKYPHRFIELIKELKSHMWIDPQTRVVFLEVTTYNAQVNLFAIMNFMVEMLPTDGMVKFYSIKVARLYTFGGGTQVAMSHVQFFCIFSSQIHFVSTFW